MPATIQPPPPALADTLNVVGAVLAGLGRRLPAHVPRDDLASAGKLALVEALLRFDGPPAQARAYCYVRVRGAVLDELRRLDPLSRHTRAQVTLVRRATAALERALNRAPADTEIAAATGLAAGAVRELTRLAAAAQPCSLVETTADGAQARDLADAHAVCPACAAEADDTGAAIRAALARLPPKHAHVLRRWHLDEATLDDIAAELGVSRERIRQLREAAEKRLRADFIVLALWQSLLSRR